MNKARDESMEHIEKRIFSAVRIHGLKFHVNFQSEFCGKGRGNLYMFTAREKPLICSSQGPTTRRTSENACLLPTVYHDRVNLYAGVERKKPRLDGWNLRSVLPCREN